MLPLPKCELGNTTAAWKLKKKDWKLQNERRRREEVEEEQRVDPIKLM